LAGLDDGDGRKNGIMEYWKNGVMGKLSF